MRPTCLIALLAALVASAVALYDVDPTAALLLLVPVAVSQLWVSTASSVTTLGKVAVTSATADALTVTGGADIGGVIQAGSGNVAITNAAGNIQESAIADELILARVAASETISGTWTHTAPVIFDTDAGAVPFRVDGRTLDNIAIIPFNTAAGTEVARIVTGGTPSGLTIGTGAGVTRVFIDATTGHITFSNGRINTNLSQPGFLAYNGNSGTGLLTGTTTIPFDVVVYDQGGVFASNTFTAGVTGHYLITVAVGIATTAGAFDVRLITTGGTYQLGRHISTEVRTAAATTLVPMTSSDTAVVQVVTAASGNLVGLSGGVRYTWFSARLVI